MGQDLIRGRNSPDVKVDHNIGFSYLGFVNVPAYMYVTMQSETTTV